MSSGRALELGDGEQPTVAETMEPLIETAVDSATGVESDYAGNPSPNAGRAIADGDQWGLGLPGSGVGWQP
jgi:hypothetical protein